jgi:hypothetical protein
MVFDIPGLSGSGMSFEDLQKCYPDLSGEDTKAGNCSPLTGKANFR